MVVCLESLNSFIKVNVCLDKSRYVNSKCDIMIRHLSQSLEFSYFISDKSYHEKMFRIYFPLIFRRYFNFQKIYWNFINFYNTYSSEYSRLIEDASSFFVNAFASMFQKKKVLADVWGCVKRSCKPRLMIKGDGIREKKCYVLKLDPAWLLKVCR